MTFVDGVQPFCVKCSELQRENAEGNKKNLRSTSANLNYKTMKETLKKCFLMYGHWNAKTVFAVKEEEETIHFNRYRNPKKKILWRKK